jgi:hypothetical protein
MKLPRCAPWLLVLACCVAAATPQVMIYDAGLFYAGNGWYVDRTHYPRAIGETLRSSASVGDQVRLPVCTTDITLIVPKAPNLGIATVQVGGRQTEVNQYSPYPLWQVAVPFSGLSEGCHNFWVNVTGRKSPESTGSAISIDAVAIGLPVGDPRFIGPGWRLQGAATFSSTAQDAMSFTFTGTEVTYIYTAGPDRGIAAITIDGIDRGTLDAYSAEAPHEQRVSYPLNFGTHNLHVSVTGKANPRATGTRIDVASKPLATPP